MVVAGTAQIGVVEERGRTAGHRVALTGEEGGDAPAIEDAQFDGARRHRFDANRIEDAIGAQNAKAGAEPLFGMRPAGEHGADQAASGVSTILPAHRRNRSGVHSARQRRWELGIWSGSRAVLVAHVTALMDADALAPMEDLDGSRGDPHVDLGADERVRNRIRESRGPRCDSRD